MATGESSPKKGGPFNNSFNNHETDLIDIINDLQNKLVASDHSLEISLPQIVAVGCQNAGKSSVLERFVGKEFLPHGAGLVTRRPVVVQLIPNPGGEEYGVFLHRGERFTDFDEIRQEIKGATDTECGPMGFSKNPISLKIYSPKVLKLTVVDLPGLVKNATGEQDEEVVKTVPEMVLDYIKPDKAIILAMTPAEQEVAISDALEIAKIVDPNRERTIGVLTKLDKVDRGSEAAVRDTLDNSLLFLKRGWVGVVNRNTQEVEEGKDMEYILRKEKDFFRKNELLSHMAHRMGIPYLQKLLQKTLRDHIKHCLPDLRKDISVKLSRYEKELKELETIIGSGPNGTNFYIISLIQRFSEDINMKIMGFSDALPQSHEVAHGALINFKLQTDVQRFLSQAMHPDGDDITATIASINGMRNAISIPSHAINVVCRQLIMRFKDSLDASVTYVQDTFVDAVKKSASLLDTYPSLKNEVLYHVNMWIDNECESTKERLRSHIEAEASYINIGHPDFDSTECNGVAPSAGPVKVWNTSTPIDTRSDDQATYINLLKGSEEMQKQVKYVTALVEKYLQIVQKQVSDTAIKYIAYFLVKKVLDSIKYDLAMIILDSANTASFKEDCEDDIRRKEEIESICNCLREALDAIKAF